MTIGILKLTIFIQDSNSLKEKRMVLQSIESRVRNNFNVAISQIGDGDKWQKASIAVVGIGRSRKNMNAILSDVVNFIEGFNSVNLINYEMEMI